MNFSEKLTYLRKQKGLSQEELGEKLDVTRQTISKWELGQTSPDTTKLIEIANFFEVSVEDFTNEEKNVKEDTYNSYDTQTSNEGSKKGIIIVVVILALILCLVGVILFKILAFGTGIFNNSRRMKNLILDASEKVVNTIQDEIKEQEDEYFNVDVSTVTESVQNTQQEIKSSTTNTTKQDIKADAQELLNDAHEMQQSMMQNASQEQKDMLQKAQAKQQEILQKMK